MVNGVFAHFATACTGGGFLGFPTWYHYLQGVTDPANGLCSPQISGLSDIWLIVAAVIEILLRASALIAVIFVIIGGINYITSQGEPERTSHARGAIINALVGLVISVLAAVIIGFIAGSIN